uniref:UBC core domain-containing protein n=1 Tax=Aplanochytrium stocchinoi TaxID=215587 RepID=A0A7S3PMT9_9STRA|mmetsp:Transcript_640/g.831  ORF Transcript_640/g.831 Transcript_640/m.831 type:complete len:203 (-) Transcript_640:676-1284(-)
MDLDVNFKENVNVHMDIINTNPSENAVNVNRSDPEPEYKYEDGENILRKDDTMDRRFDLGLKLSSHEKRNLTSTPSKKNSNGASTCGGGGKYLENAFAQHRFGKDIHDLTHSRNQAFSPHALVSFHTYNRTSPKSATNNIKKEKKMELFTLVCGIKPQEGLYAGFECSFEMNITHGYPFHPPSVNCRTLGIYHPNINPSTGK